MKYVTSNPELHGHRVLCLSDNFSVACSLAKGRSTSGPLLQVCRRISALALASRILLAVLWLPSEGNPADLPSRARCHAGAFVAR
eukprot:5115402-Amphidinium_carterae.1